MAIELAQEVIKAGTRYNGFGAYEMQAGERIVINVAGATELDQTVPANKVLTVILSIRADLVDA